MRLGLRLVVSVVWSQPVDGAAEMFCWHAVTAALQQAGREGRHVHIADKHCPRGFGPLESGRG